MQAFDNKVDDLRYAILAVAAVKVGYKVGPNYFTIAKYGTLLTRL